MLYKYFLLPASWLLTPVSAVPIPLRLFSSLLQLSFLQPRARPSFLPPQLHAQLATSFLPPQLHARPSFLLPLARQAAFFLPPQLLARLAAFFLRPQSRAFYAIHPSGIYSSTSHLSPKTPLASLIPQKPQKQISP